MRRPKWGPGHFYRFPTHCYPPLCTSYMDSCWAHVPNYAMAAILTQRGTARRQQDGEDGAPRPPVDPQEARATGCGAVREVCREWLATHDLTFEEWCPFELPAWCPPYYITASNRWPSVRRVAANDCTLSSVPPSSPPSQTSSIAHCGVHACTPTPSWGSHGTP